MLLFCPACANVLTVSRTSGSDEHPAGVNRLACRTCPYQFIIEKRYFERRMMKHQELEDVMGGPGSMDNADRTDVQCKNEKCEGSQAYFRQMQTRSADEPMTISYECMTCHTRWVEN